MAFCGLRTEIAEHGQLHEAVSDELHTLVAELPQVWMEKYTVRPIYLDNLDDEMNITALRMLVEELLILFGPPPKNPSPFGPSPTSQGTSPFPVFGQASEQKQPFNPASSFNPNQQPIADSPFSLPQRMQHQRLQPPPFPQNSVNNALVLPCPASAR